MTITAYIIFDETSLLKLQWTKNLNGQPSKCHEHYLTIV